MLNHIFHLNLSNFNYHALEVRRQKELEEARMLSGPSEDGLPTQQVTTVRHTGDQLGRNDQCKCGSGKKYKKCCI